MTEIAKKTEVKEEIVSAMMVAGDTPIIIPGIEGRIDKSFGPFVLEQELDPTTKKPVPSRYMTACLQMIQVKPPILKAVNVPASQVKTVGPGLKVPRPEKKNQPIMDLTGTIVPDSGQKTEGYVDVLNT